MIPERGKQSLLALIGVSAGVASGLWLYRQVKKRRTAGPRGWAEPRGSAQEVAEALRQDEALARRPIEVDSVSEGVVELSGSVRDRDEAERAVRVAQRTTGVYTVVNRLVVDEEETRRESTRRRWNDGAPELRERQHYGMGVGMGTRRQSPETDPDRPSDRQRMVERDLEVRNLTDEPAATPDRMSEDAGEVEPEPAPGSGTDAAVESSRVKPGDERAIEEAGLAAQAAGAEEAEVAGDGEAHDAAEVGEVGEVHEVGEDETAGPVGDKEG